MTDPARRRCSSHSVFSQSPGPRRRAHTSATERLREVPGLRRAPALPPRRRGPHAAHRRGRRRIPAPPAEHPHRERHLRRPTTERRDQRLTQASLAQNEEVKRISSWTAILFAPTLVVGTIYGMNFDHMPELNWLLGYPFAVWAGLRGPLPRVQATRMALSPTGEILRARFPTPHGHKAADVDSVQRDEAPRG
jgi:hypothetical protein